MPKLWTPTIGDHRRAVRDAVLDTTADLVAEHGIAGVTMSAIAAGSGIGRATLYKYFPDVTAVLVAWHERHIAEHVIHLAEVADRHSGNLDAVLTAYALSLHHTRDQAGTEIAATLHQGDHVTTARSQVHTLLARLITEARGAGQISNDSPATELATYTLHALNAATALPSQAAVRRLVATTLRGLR